MTFDLIRKSKKGAGRRTEGGRSSFGGSGANRLRFFCSYYGRAIADRTFFFFKKIHGNPAGWAPRRQEACRRQGCAVAAMRARWRQKL
ncbi:hypothetical protein [Lignipirellula cremea]|uniref:hypothetical protein n=1 Tax=Lignipirellula cremea TaxID=2528010 RepID=UPI0011A8B81F|nr:hypothetical protein [Lignipirellula cremea]